jgi:hypothetical protein
MLQFLSLSDALTTRRLLQQLGVAAQVPWWGLGQWGLILHPKPWISASAVYTAQQIRVPLAIAPMQNSDGRPWRGIIAANTRRKATEVGREGWPAWQNKGHESSNQHRFDQAAAQYGAT